MVLRRTLLAGCFVSLVVVPLSWVSTSAHADLNQRFLAQIEFTPNVATLQAQATPEAILAPFVWEAGRAFDCPVGLPDRCRPELTTMAGDDYFGYGEISGAPGLRLVWVTDESGTHYLVVDETNPGFGGSLPDDFSDFIAQRDAAIAARDGAQSTGQTTVAVGGTAVLVMVALCPETLGATCLGAGIGIVVAGIANTIIQSSNSRRADRDLEAAEANLLGRFGALRPSPGNP
jgi:hypothetical protein